MAIVAIRFLAALILVFLSYNPAGYSYYHWAVGVIHDAKFTSTFALASVALVIGWVLFLGATFRALGWLGITLVMALLASLVWVLIDQGWLSTDNQVLSYVGLVVLSAVLALGMSWSHLWRKLSGQVEVDEVGD